MLHADGGCCFCVSRLFQLFLEEWPKHEALVAAAWEKKENFSTSWAEEMKAGA